MLRFPLAFYWLSGVKWIRVWSHRPWLRLLTKTQLQFYPGLWCSSHNFVDLSCVNIYSFGGMKRLPLLYKGPRQMRDWALLQFCTFTSTRTFTGRNNVFPYFVNSTETWSCLNPSRFRPAETWWSSFPWTGRVSVMFPSRKRTIMFLPHFCYHISVLSCFHYVSDDVFFKPMSKIPW